MASINLNALGVKILVYLQYAVVIIYAPYILHTSVVDLIVYPFVRVWRKQNDEIGYIKDKIKESGGVIEELKSKMIVKM